MRPHPSLPAVVPLALLLGCSPDPADPAPPAAPPEASTPSNPGGRRTAQCAGPEYDVDGQVFFGDLHAHTAFSLDAWSFGTGDEPADAAANAEFLGLDFVAITDHAEFLAVTYGCVANTASSYYGLTNPLPYAIPSDCPELRGAQPDPANEIFEYELGISAAICQLAGWGSCLTEMANSWEDTLDQIDAHDDPCTFTTLAGWEWTGTDLATGAPIHRNVIFGDYAAHTDLPDRPFDALSHLTPPDLWEALETGCDGGPCDAVTIPHNTNRSQGLSLVVWPGAADLQRKYQVSGEIFQHKGASECNADTGEAACAFERHVPAGQSAVDASYLRHALGEGARFAGTDPEVENPLRLGFVGGTDGHNARPGDVGETTWLGHSSRDDDTPAERLSGERAEFNPGGLTGVWAPENTRAALFDAIRRRETYATSGPKIRLRVNYVGNDDQACDPDHPWDHSVPMGGTFDPTGLADPLPRFRVEVSPDVTDLESVEMIRITADAAGNTTTRIVPVPLEPYDSGDTGVQPGITARGGCAIVTDADFDPAQYTTYYVRVLEEATPRWSTFDCEALTPGACAEEPIHERAWSSPIWYELPEGGCDPDLAGWTCHDVYLDEDHHRGAVSSGIDVRGVAGGASEVYLAYEVRSDESPHPHTLYVDGYTCAGVDCQQTTHLPDLPAALGEDVLHDQWMMPSMVYHTDPRYGPEVHVTRRSREAWTGGCAGDYANLGPTAPGARYLDLEHLVWTPRPSTDSGYLDVSPGGAACVDRGRSDLVFDANGAFDACWRRGNLPYPQIWCSAAGAASQVARAAVGVPFNHPGLALGGGAAVQMSYSSASGGPTVNAWEPVPQAPPAAASFPGVAGTADHPDIAVTGDGVIVMVWEDLAPPPSDSEIRAAFCDPSTPAGCSAAASWTLTTVARGRSVRAAHVAADEDTVMIAYQEDTDTQTVRNRVEVASNCLLEDPQNPGVWSWSRADWAPGRVREPANPNWDQSLIWGRSAIAFDTVNHVAHVTWVEASEPLEILGLPNYTPEYAAHVFWASAPRPPCGP